MTTADDQPHTARNSRELARRLLDGCSLQSVYLALASCSRTALELPTNRQLELETEPGFRALSDNRVAFRVRVKFRLRAAGDGGESPPLAEIEESHDAIYDIPVEPSPTAPELDAFAIHVAVMTVWPYARAHLSATALAMGLGDIVLPLVIPDDGAPNDQDHDSSGPGDAAD